MLPDPEARGHALLKRLERLGVSDWHEVLLCVPKTFLDYSKITPLKLAMPQQDLVPSRHLFRLVVSESASIVTQPKKRIILIATDGMFSVRVICFDLSKVSDWKSLCPGDIVHIEGALQKWNAVLQIVSPEIIPQEKIGQAIPVYEKRRGVVADGAIFDASRYALLNCVGETIEHLVNCYHDLSEKEIISRARLKAPSLEAVLRAAHAPTTEEEGLRGVAAMKRLAALSVVETAKRLKQRTNLPGSVVRIPREMIDELVDALPYPLTEDQRAAIDDIVQDMASPFPMRRVLSGDVGCGKSLCLLIPALATQRLGLFAIILTPNALLSDQLVKECKAFYGDSTNILLVTAATRELDLSSNPILVGTTALLTRLRESPPPALYCVDEQQKFSVGQKVELAGLTSNYLESTATPIPRTTALITHGAMDVTLIRQLPVRKTILTKIVQSADAKRLFAHTRKVIHSGGQVAIVYPIVDNPAKEKESVKTAYEMWDSHFPGKVAMVHGHMKEEEKIEAITGLKRGDQQIAIVSTVIEIGLTLGNLRSVVVVHAERHGTSTLHQLRGRVARRGGTGYFFLFLPEAVSEETMKRLRLLEEYSDGFELSERDAELRGYGDLFENAERQSGSSRSTVFRCVELTPSDIHRVSAAQPIAA